MPANKLVTIGSSLILGCVTSLSASAAEPVKGYIKSGTGKNIVKSTGSECVRTGQKYTYEYLEECGYEVVETEKVVTEQVGGEKEIAVVEQQAVIRGDEVLAETEVELVRVVISDVQFPFNSAELTPQFKAEIDNIVTALDPHRPLLRDNIEEIVITGHTDSTGPAAYNQRLSERRAQAVADYLVNDHDFRPDHIIVKGLGEGEPIADNSTEMGRKRNRRVELETVKN